MLTTLLHLLLRTALLTAVVASTALYVDYGKPEPSFCGAQSGCAAVRDSMYSNIAGVSLPAIGMGVFVGLFAMALWASTERHHRLLALQTGVVALGAVALIGLQLFVVKALCAYCMAVDIAAIVAFACAQILATREPLEQSTPLRFVWAAVGVVAVAAPLTWEHEVPTAHVPDGVAKHYRDGMVNIVMFTDFECPFCRMLHPAVHDVVEKNRERVNLVRVMMPLRGHPGAEPAALAYLCTPDAAKDRMADALYDASSEVLTVKGVAQLAKELQLDHLAIARCMDDEKTRARLEDDKQLFMDAELKGLPATFVNDHLVAGADEPALLSAVEASISRRNVGADVRWMFALLVVLGMAAMAVSLKAASANAQET